MYIAAHKLIPTKNKGYNLIEVYTDIQKKKGLGTETGKGWQKPNNSGKLSFSNFNLFGFVLLYRQVLGEIICHQDDKQPWHHGKLGA